MRLFVSFILSPLALVVPALCWTAIKIGLDEPGFLNSEPSMASAAWEFAIVVFSIVGFGACFAYPILLVAGLPTYLALRRFGAATVVNLCAAGILYGAAFGLLFVPDWAFIFIMAACGASVAIAFCLLAGRQ